MGDGDEESRTEFTEGTEVRGTGISYRKVGKGRKVRGDASSFALGDRHPSSPCGLRRGKSGRRCPWEGKVEGGRENLRPRNKFGAQVPEEGYLTGRSGTSRRSCRAMAVTRSGRGAAQIPDEIGAQAALPWKEYSFVPFRNHATWICIPCKSCVASLIVLPFRPSRPSCENSYLLSVSFYSRKMSHARRPRLESPRAQRGMRCLTSSDPLDLYGSRGESTEDTEGECLAQSGIRTNRLTRSQRWLESDKLRLVYI